MVRRVLLLTAFLSLLPVGRSFGFDLFGFLGLPEAPIVLATPDWASRTSSLRLSQTYEELYRSWVDGQEVSRFDGQRSAVDLAFDLTSRVGVRLAQSLKSRQTWMNREESRAEAFDLESAETWREAEILFRLRGGRLALFTRSSRDRYAGSYPLDSSIVKALGKQPGIEFDNSWVSRGFRWFRAGSSPWTWLVERERGTTSHRLSTTGVRMVLEVPLDQTIERDLVELGYTGFRRFLPYVRRQTWRESGKGDSMKDQRFRFGKTSSEFHLRTLSLGVGRDGRRPWFCEFSRHECEGRISISNNLITLDPLFLFLTNEVINRERLEPTRPWGFRLGGEIPLSWGWRCEPQYSLTRMIFQRVSETEKIYNFRRTSAITARDEENRLLLHRLRIDAIRPDAHGGWSVRLDLMVPQNVTRETPEVAPAGPSGPPAPSAPKKEKSVRGGWQLFIQREFTL